MKMMHEFKEYLMKTFKMTKFDLMDYVLNIEGKTTRGRDFYDRMSLRMPS